MTPDDLARLHAACFTAPRPWNAQEFRDLLTGPGCFLVTEDAGFALGRALAGEAELLTIAVDPAARRGGTGRRLMARFESEALTRGADEAFLEVAADNTAAIGLYLGAGFAQAGRRKGYYQMPQGAAIDALILRKPLGTRASG
ncbi:GNAT family N-acetyltransferase [Actibacterium sp.]|uniref:GNAT family N-acetyltransferase n=1 Tax=Actibacterium sp. TaxID=1872125 RepID=UPI00356A16E3